MKRVLFLIHDLGPGGAEKVLVNLVNNLDRDQFDITVMVLFGGGVNEQRVKTDIRLVRCFPKSFPGNSHVMKLFSPEFLYRHLIREHFDIVVSYLEGPCNRIIGGCHDEGTRKIAWIHSNQHSIYQIARSFRSIEEAEMCYRSFDRIVCVSKTVRESFLRHMPVPLPVDVLYNTNESDKILCLSKEKVELGSANDDERILIGVGKLTRNKGFDRIIRIAAKLRSEHIPVRVLLLGEGPERKSLSQLAADEGVSDIVSFLGYQMNPYQYLARADLFVCASFSEGFSTAATEALIVGTPVCTVEVSGMREMLGDCEYGLITKNNEEALYQSVKRMLTEPGLLDSYRKKAQERGKSFSTDQTVKAVEKMLNAL